MKQLLLNVVTALSLLACTAVAWLWWRDGRSTGQHDLLTARLAGPRYTLRSGGGRLALYAPPPPEAVPPWLAATAGGTPAEWVGRLGNDQVVWEVEFPLRTFPDLKLGPHYTPRARDGTPAYVLAPVDPGEKMPPEMNFGPTRLRPRPPFALARMARPLLAALEDPGRFVAAHVVLMQAADNVYWRRDAPGRHFERAENDPLGFVLEADGLRADLKAAVGPGRFYTYSPSYGDDFEVCACSASVDARQRHDLVRQWHARLDVPLASPHYWVVALAALALPAGRGGAWAARKARGRNRRRTGRCVRCGYDLRGAGGPCPECGVEARGDGAS